MTIMGARARASLHHVDTSCACRRARYRCHRSRRIIGLDAMKLPVVSPQRAASWRYSARLARIAPSVSAVGFGLVRGQVESAMYHGTYARDDDAALQLARVLASLPPSLSCFPFLPLREREREIRGEKNRRAGRSRARRIVFPRENPKRNPTEARFVPISGLLRYEGEGGLPLATGRGCISILALVIMFAGN